MGGGWRRDKDEGPQRPAGMGVQFTDQEAARLGEAEAQSAAEARIRGTRRSRCPSTWSWSRGRGESWEKTASRECPRSGPLVDWSDLLTVEAPGILGHGFCYRL
jgi:hypothetical protein